jgi:mannose-6-phosphate isomerase
MEVDNALGKAILGFADKHGVDNATGLVYDQVSDQGQLTQSTHRLWVQTEAIKAWLIRSDAEEGQRERAVERIEGNLLKYYLDLEPRGIWGDRLDVKGNPMKGPVPTSSMYHLMVCVTELAAWRADRKG